MAEQSEVPIALANSGDIHNLGLHVTDLAAAKLRLFLDGFAPNPTNVAADFIAAEVTFTGYTAGGYTLTWSAVGVGADGNAVSESNRVFSQITALPANSVGGMWIEDAGGDLLWYVVFPQPVNLNNVLNFVGLTVKLRERGVATVDVDS